MSDVPTSTRRDFVEMAGTGDRGSGMWGRDLVQRYPDLPDRHRDPEQYRSAEADQDRRSGPPVMP
jgi:hypothetical protein